MENFVSDPPGPQALLAAIEVVRAARALAGRALPERLSDGWKVCRSPADWCAGGRGRDEGGGGREAHR